METFISLGDTRTAVAAKAASSLIVQGNCTLLAKAAASGKVN
jgi:hypothetical protein